MLSQLLLTFTSAIAVAATVQTFGEPITLTEKTNLGQAMTSTSDDKDILVDGRIKQVCKKKGCWMTLSEGDTEVRVTFKGYAFFVPKDSDGKSVLAQGRLVEKLESVSDQRHYLKDAGASKEEIAAIKAPKKVKSFVASGVQIRP